MMNTPLITQLKLEKKSAACLPPVALYIHWPFCVSKCPYCDFNSHVRDSVDHNIWQKALLADMEYEADLTVGRPISSIFFGGGTPSLMPPAIVAALINRAQQLWGFTKDIEITLEANPSSVEAARFADLAKAGVNRISLGLQALDDDALAFLGRAHSVQESLYALEIAQNEFARVSIDLIYARPKQSETAWQSELSRAIAFGTSHMSLYQLTIEEGTRFASDVRNGAFTPADNDYAAGLFEITQSMMQDAGMPAYEISNHAKQGEESRHNLTYWRYQDYIGIGPGAHGRRLSSATQRHKKPENYLSGVDRNRHGIKSEENLDPATKAIEALLMGLRLREGVDMHDVATRSGILDAGLGQNRHFDAELLIEPDAEAHISSLGMLRRDGNRLTITPKGMPLLDAILPQIVSVKTNGLSQ
jgi:putative oxygen-independent coproporphyrinogen III oxidase